MVDVSVVRCGSYDAAQVRTALSAALEPLGGLSWVRAGMRIAIKTNLVLGAKPDLAATTHPAILTALTELLVAKGASVIIGDSPGGPFTAAYVGLAYSAAGLHQCRDAGAELNKDFSQQTVTAPDARAAKDFVCTAYLNKVDAIINVCKLKTHGMMGMSGSVKNMFGAIAGTVKPEYHYRFPDQRSFSDMLIDLNEYFHPVLNIADAVVGMEGNGPTQGTPRAVGCIAASKSPYALDLVLADLIGLDKDDVPSIQVAFERGLAPDAVNKLSIETDVDLSAVRVADFRRSESSSDLLFGQKLPDPFGKILCAVAKKAMASVPDCDVPSCIGCGKCASVCPAKAVGMVNKRPKIDRKACIRCFCCQEFCPVGSMRVHRPLVARLLGGK